MRKKRRKRKSNLDSFRFLNKNTKKRIQQQQRNDDNDNNDGKKSFLQVFK